LALGYGRKAALKEEMQVGINAYSLYKVLMMYNRYITKGGGDHEFACAFKVKKRVGRGISSKKPL
jgi:molybdopterin-containing oxidoreductase family iron-sulfur binding subunit